MQTASFVLNNTCLWSRRVTFKCLMLLHRLGLSCTLEAAMVCLPECSMPTVIPPCCTTVLQRILWLLVGVGLLLLLLAMGRIGPGYCFVAMFFLHQCRTHQCGSKGGCWYCACALHTSCFGFAMPMCLATWFMCVSGPFFCQRVAGAQPVVLSCVCCVGWGHKVDTPVVV